MANNLTVTVFTGDGIFHDLIEMTFGLAGGSNSIAVNGAVQKVGNVLQAVAGTATSPGVPGSGTNYYVVVIDYTNGTIAVHNSTTDLATARAAIGATEMEVMNQTLPANNDTNIADYAVQTPDST